MSRCPTLALVTTLLLAGCAQRGPEEPETRPAPPGPVTYEGRSLDEWLGLLVHETQRGRESAVAALMAVGEPAVEPLRARMREPDSGFRFAACRVLWNLAVQDQSAAALDRAVPELLLCLDDPDPGTRAAAAEALGALGSSALEAGPRLAASLDEEDWFVRYHAARALGRIGYTSGGARTRLERIAHHDRRRWVRMAAEQALR